MGIKLLFIKDGLKFWIVKFVGFGKKFDCFWVLIVKLCNCKRCLGFLIIIFCKKRLFIKIFVNGLNFFENIVIGEIIDEFIVGFRYEILYCFFMIWNNLKLFMGKFWLIFSCWKVKFFILNFKVLWIFGLIIYCLEEIFFEIVLFNFK